MLLFYSSSLYAVSTKRYVRITENAAIQNVTIVHPQVNQL